MTVPRVPEHSSTIASEALGSWAARTVQTQADMTPAQACGIRTKPASREHLHPPIPPSHLAQPIYDVLAAPQGTFKSAHSRKSGGGGAVFVVIARAPSLAARIDSAAKIKATAPRGARTESSALPGAAPSPEPKGGTQSVFFVT